MANKQRGEVTIVLSGREYTLRPTFDALCQIEDMLHKTILEVVSDLQDQKISVRALAVIAHAGIRAVEGDKAPTISQLGEAIVSEGLMRAMTGVNNHEGLLTFLLNGILGGEEPAEANPQDGANVQQ